MRFKNTILLVLGLLVSMHANAVVTDDGNVGGVLKCGDKYFPLSFFRADRSHGLWAPNIAGATLGEKIETLLKKLSRFDSRRAEAYRVSSRKVLDHASFLHGVSLAFSPIKYEQSYPQGCQAEQVILYRAPQIESESSYLIDADLWAQLSPDTQAVLILEVVFYQEAVLKEATSYPHVDHSFTIAVSELALTVTSQEEGPVPIIRYTNPIERIGLSGYDVFGIQMKGVPVPNDPADVDFASIGYPLNDPVRIEFQGKPRLIERGLQFDGASRLRGGAFVEPEEVTLISGQVIHAAAIELNPSGKISEAVFRDSIPFLVTHQGAVDLTLSASFYSDGQVASGMLLRESSLKINENTSYPCAGNKDEYSYSKVTFDQLGYVTSCELRQGTHVKAANGDIIVLSPYGTAMWNKDGTLKTWSDIKPNVYNATTDTGVMSFQVHDKWGGQDVKIHSLKLGSADLSSPDYGDFSAVVTEDFIADGPGFKPIPVKAGTLVHFFSSGYLSQWRDLRMDRRGFLISDGSDSRSPTAQVGI